MRVWENIKNIVRLVNAIDSRLQKIQQSLGRIEDRQLVMQNPMNFHDYEYQVYSQWGEDGLIQYLISRVAIERPIFVEFGVATYVESNTRFLLMNNNWSGLIIDGTEQNIQHIKNDPIYWQHNLKAECAFIDKDNINLLIQKNGISGDIGLLSIDIDGNDYWVWKEIEIVSPRIVVIEYNSRFGPNRAVTIPYCKDFTRQQAHHSLVYYGASLSALVNLGKQKGYAFVGCNKNGVNAFFVRSDLLVEPIQEVTVEAGYMAGKFREARDANGTLLFLTAEEEKAILDKLPLVELAD